MTFLLKVPWFMVSVVAQSFFNQLTFRRIYASRNRFSLSSIIFKATDFGYIQY